MELPNIISTENSNNEINLKFSQLKSENLGFLNGDESYKHMEDNSVAFKSTHTDENTSVKREEEILLTCDKNIAKPLLWPQLLAALAAGSIHLHFGVIMAYSAVVIPVLTDPNSTGIYLNNEQIALFSSINNIGTIFGSLASGYPMVKVGQRVTLLFILPFGVFGWLLLANTTNYHLLILSRIVVGILLGVSQTSTNSFLLEVVHTSVRGRLMASLDVLRPVGFLYVSALGSTNLHWQTVGMICGLSTFVLPFLILIFLPNSPRWLVTHGRRVEARKSLTFYRGACYNVEKEVDDIFVQLEQTPNSGKIFNQIKFLNNTKMCRRFSILAIMMLCIQVTGNIVTVAYSVSIYKAAEIKINAYLSAIISCVVRILGAVTNLVIADKYKRKTIILPAMLLSAISMTGIGIYFYLIKNYAMSDMSWAFIPLMVVYLFSTAAYQPSFLVMRGELLPTAIRAVGSSIHFSLMSVGMFAAIYSFPYMVSYIGYHWTFWLFVIDISVLFLIVVFLVPETKNKTLEEIAHSM